MTHFKDMPPVKRTAHLLSFFSALMLFSWSLWRSLYMRNEDNAMLLEIIFYIGVLHTALVVAQMHIIINCESQNRLSFIMPALVLFVLCVDLIFFKCGIEFFWLICFITYTTGALYNGSLFLLLYILFSQFVFFSVYKINEKFGLFSMNPGDIYLWILITISGLLFLLALNIIARGNKKTSFGNTLYKTIMSTTPNAIVLVDSLMRVLAVSDMFTKMFHTGAWYTCTGRPLVDLLPGDVKLLVWEITNGENVTEMLKELEIFNDTGYYRIICDRIEGRKENNIYITIVNVTPIMKAKLQVEKASKAKDIFLAKVSHEIRTPLNAIAGMSELILRENISARVREYAASVQTAGKNLVSIINDILDFTKIESGNMEIIEKSYEFETLLNDVLNIIRMRLLEKPVFFVTKIDSTMPRSLIGDVVRLRQILINLLNNAVKYTDTGFIELSINCEKTNNERLLLKMSVSDSGRGIKEQDFSRIFGEFVQIDTQQNRNIEGSGLGLTVTKSLCYAMGGNISMQSVYGKGSVFNIELPQRISDARPIAEVEFPETKKALVCESRELYANSMAWSLDNLKIKNKIVSGISDLKEFFSSGSSEWNYIFTAAFFYEEIMELAKELNINAKVAALAEADVVTAENVYALPLPAHTISIARVLNNKTPDYASDETSKLNIGWTAPQANILVVDDINTNIIVTEGLMSPYKMKVTGALSGKSAIELVKQQKFDVIFMDHMMPEMDGIETVMWLKTLPNAKGVPIIALTANAIRGVEQMFRKNGFYDMLVKPVEILKLHELLEKYVPEDKRKKVEPETSGAARFFEKQPQLFNGQNKETGFEIFNVSGDAAQKTEYGIFIDGIDLEKGINNAGGSEETYRKILNVYQNESRTLLNKLKAAVKISDAKSWTTCVHGIKSSSANIGAMGISEFAKKLEDAGRSEEWGTISSEAPLFFEQFEALLEDISFELDFNNKQNEDTESEKKRIK
jgi:signal transduction histidine kinase/HPt (histidine-containing phosphotransfer) domain-containing protein/FixJ family two-component response regulator